MSLIKMFNKINKIYKTSWKKNQNQVINDFGNEWAKFDNVLSQIQNLKNFKLLFLYFPKKFFNKKTVGIDLGSGSGRWAKFIIPKIKKIYLLEPSVKAINVSKKKFKKYKNIEYLNIEIKKLNLKIIL